MQNASSKSRAEQRERKPKHSWQSSYIALAFTYVWLRVHVVHGVDNYDDDALQTIVMGNSKKAGKLKTNIILNRCFIHDRFVNVPAFTLLTYLELFVYEL